MEQHKLAILKKRNNCKVTNSKRPWCDRYRSNSIVEELENRVLKEREMF